MSDRIKKINELIHHELNKIILKEGGLPNDCLTTITKVQTSTDLSQTRISISVLPNNKQGTILKILNNNAKHLQFELAKFLPIRKTPKIQFKIDEEQQKAVHIDELIDKIHREG